MEALLRIAALAILAGMVQFAVMRAWRSAKRPFRHVRLGVAARSFLISMTIVCMLYSGDKDAPQRIANVKLKVENVKSALTARSMAARSGNGNRIGRVGHGELGLDTDGDGIPDDWERWTGTNPQVDDAAHDMDGDGLANLEEYLLQCDPQCADTDNDGIDDATEAAGLLAGVLDLDPLAPATFAAQVPDEDSDGTPDAWENSEACPFTGTDAQGFPLGVAVPAASWSNYDVLLAVSTSRHAMLSWGGSIDAAACLMPPCTNVALRLRLSSAETQRLTLSAVPDGETNAISGTWSATITAGWDARRGLLSEGSRIAAEGGIMVDRVADDGVTSFHGAFGAGNGSMGMSFVPKWMSLAWNGDWSCLEHGPEPVVEVAATNIPPPYLWSYDDHSLVSGDNIFTVGFPWLDRSSTEVHCREVNPEHTNLLAEASIRVGAGHCQPSTTNFVAAMAGSTHDPEDGSDHEPGIGVTRLEQPGVNCPEAFALVVTSGWTHVESILHIRNLVRIITHDPWDDETDHCIGLVWREGGFISLCDYLADCCKPFADNFAYYVNGEPCDGILEYGSEPTEFHPRVFHVELRLDSDGTVLDRMWVVVNAIDADDHFDIWYGKNHTNLAWVATLPKPYAQLALSTNFLGWVSAIDPEPGAPNLWNSPSRLSSFLHHDAKWEMRSPKNIYGHGNQACYDASGRLNRSGISGGTADYSAGTWNNFWNHVPDDVKPYLNAVHLDGNPGDTTTENNVSRPCLYQGDNIGKYIECRPIVQPEGE